MKVQLTYISIGVSNALIYPFRGNRRIKSVRNIFYKLQWIL